jgi:tRNA (guanine37-N1)-methyltransferase
MKVPEVLLSGNHAQIARWRAEQATSRTTERRPDLLAEDGQKAPENPEQARATGQSENL